MQVHRFSGGQLGSRRGVADRATVAAQYPDGFGRVSRYAHWVTATLILCLIPMGIFMSVLPPDSPDRAMFVCVQESVGLAVIVLVVCRLAWLARSAPPQLPVHLSVWERRLAKMPVFVLFRSAAARVAVPLLLEAGMAPA